MTFKPGDRVRLTERCVEISIPSTEIGKIGTVCAGGRNIETDDGVIWTFNSHYYVLESVWREVDRNETHILWEGTTACGNSAWQITSDDEKDRPAGIPRRSRYRAELGARGYRYRMNYDPGEVTDMCHQSDDYVPRSTGPIVTLGMDPASDELSRLSSDYGPRPTGPIVTDRYRIAARMNDPYATHRANLKDQLVANLSYSDEQIDGLVAARMSGRIATDEARARNFAALAPPQRKPTQFDPRPGIDDVGGFSSPTWEE